MDTDRICESAAFTTLYVRLVRPMLICVNQGKRSRAFAMISGCR